MLHHIHDTLITGRGNDQNLPPSTYTDMTSGHLFGRDPLPSIYTGTTPSSVLPTSLPGTTHTVIGQVYLRRPFHRNCILFELRTDGSLVHNTTTVLVRLGPHCEEDTVAEARLVRPGDLLEVTGTLDAKTSNKGTGTTRPMLLCASFKLQVCWKTVHPTLTFTRFERLPPALACLLPQDLQSSLTAAIEDGSDSIQPESSSSAPPTKHKEEVHPSPIETPAILEEFWNGIPLHTLCMYALSGQHGCRSRTCKLTHDIAAEGIDRGELKFAFGRWRERARAHTSELNEAVLDDRVRAAFGEDHPLVELTMPLESTTITAKTATVTPRAVHGMRAHCFAAWVLKHAPKELLEKGVLDVAGGSGEVAFILTALHGVRVTTVDPRFPATGLLSQCRTRKAWAAAHPTSPFQSLHTGIKLFFGEGGEGYYWPRGGTPNFGVALGFHPDQATEPLLDWCLATSTPFAIVPCCVFGTEAKGGKRVMGRDGSEVTSYEDFCVYLLEKSVKAGVKVKVARLPLNGRNWVLHSL